MKIKCAAIRSKADGRIFEGRSHAVCFQAMVDAGVIKRQENEQGFVTDTGKFVDRYEAAEIAYKASQTKKLESPLFSEDLTDDWPWEKKDKAAAEPKPK